MRALAVVPVILFHAGVKGIGGGFVGVDIFFVISGFLITSIIVADIEAGRFSLARFYERRVRRIIPNLYAMMLAALVASLILLIPIDLSYFGESLAAAAMSASNILFWIKTGYFEPNATQLPLLHTWSLAVEEQYYIFFPLLMLLLMRRGHAAARPVIWLLFGASLLFSIWQVRAHPTGAFYLPLGRWWELMVGSLMAVGAVPDIRSNKARESIAAAGLAAVVVAIATFSEQMRFPGEAALLPCLGTAAMIHANRGALTRVGRWLSWRPLVRIGMVSYSLYLWHWPVLVFARYALQRAPSPFEIVLLLALIAVLSVAAWRFVERPFRGSSQPGGRGRVFVIAGTATILFVGIGFGFWRAGGLPERYSPAVQRLAAGAMDGNPRRAECEMPTDDRIRHLDVCMAGDPAARPSFAFLGDSYADAMSPGIEVAAQHVGARGYVITHAGCLPLMGASGCERFWRTAYQRIAKDPDINTILVIARWSTFVEGHSTGLLGTPWALISDAQTKASNLAENRNAIARSFDRTAKLLAGKRLVIVAYYPEQLVFVPQYLALRSVFGGQIHGVPLASHKAWQSRTRSLIDAAARRDGFAVVDAGRLMCGPVECPIVADGISLYADQTHVSRSGARYFSPLFYGPLAASRH